MARKKNQDLKNLTADELKAKVRETESSLFKNRMKFKTGQLDDVAVLWKERKNLARVKTFLTQKTQTLNPVKNEG